MSKKILLLIGSNNRHLQLAQFLANSYPAINFEVIAEEKGDSLNVEKNLEKEIFGKHKGNLERAMDKVLSSFCTLPPIKNFKNVDRGYFNNQDFLTTIEAKANQYILVGVYGTGIISRGITDLFRGKIIGSHQGLPQYYRGSGSNFFAFIEQNPSLMGVSIHFLDPGIDTGDIIFQEAPVPAMDDDYYSFSAKLVLKTFDLYKLVVKEALDSNLKGTSLHQKGKLFQRKDLTEDKLQLAFEMMASRPFYQWHESSAVRPVIISGKTCHA